MNKWSKEQDDKPYLRFSTANAAGSDPGEETEAVGDADAVKSTALGMKNLQRVSKMLMSATAYKDGETYNDLAEVYGRMLSQWQTEMSHVAQIVGGFNSQEKTVGQEGRIFTLVPKVRQEEAVKYLMENAFTTPLWVLDPEILRRIEAVGAIDRISQRAQRSVMTNLLNSPRFARLIEQEAIDGTAAYAPTEFLGHRTQGSLEGAGLSAGESGRLSPCPAAHLSGPGERQAESSTRPGSRRVPRRTPRLPGGRWKAAALQRPVPMRSPCTGLNFAALTTSVNAAIAKAADHETKAHLEGVRDEIAKILDPKFLPPAPAAVAGGGRGGLR